ncbi:unnamed protein product [Oppiella nova]|uniref:ACB domain-containing protein n=1 Tax=Oppiella nova TaxID=334625 RepID=A0A7R9QN76_9ACAR|nr:unnamed protein product [Oppiella nova]CAG2169454.1 unnamed protein product [Oppiella nova]
MTTSAEQRFEAAVRVIRALPKSGHYKPTDELRLQFYAYYKQATDGPNTTKKPAFYDLVGKYKWEAWSRLGDTSREEAMEGYVRVFVESLKNMMVAEEDRDVFEPLAPFKEYLPDQSQQEV